MMRGRGKGGRPQFTGNERFPGRPERAWMADGGHSCGPGLSPGFNRGKHVESGRPPRRGGRRGKTERTDGEPASFRAPGLAARGAHSLLYRMGRGPARPEGGEARAEGGKERSDRGSLPTFPPFAGASSRGRAPVHLIQAFSVLRGSRSSSTIQVPISHATKRSGGGRWTCVIGHVQRQAGIWLLRASGGDARWRSPRSIEKTLSMARQADEANRRKPPTISHTRAEEKNKMGGAPAPIGSGKINDFLSGIPFFPPPVPGDGRHARAFLLLHSWAQAGSEEGRGPRSSLRQVGTRCPHRWSMPNSRESEAAPLREARKAPLSDLITGATRAAHPGLSPPSESISPWLERGVFIEARCSAEAKRYQPLVRPFVAG